MRRDIWRRGGLGGWREENIPIEKLTPDVGNTCQMGNPHGYIPRRVFNHPWLLTECKPKIEIPRKVLPTRKIMDSRQRREDR